MPTPKTQSDFRDPILLNEKELSIHYRANKSLSWSNNENTNEQQYAAIVVIECTKEKGQQTNNTTLSSSQMCLTSAVNPRNMKVQENSDQSV